MVVPWRFVALGVGVVGLGVAAAAAAITITGNAPWSSSASAGSCRGPSTYVTHGPRVGVVSGDTVRFWVRTCRPAEVAIELTFAGESWDSNEVTKTAPATTDAGADNTAVFSASGLFPRTEYAYRVVVEGVVADAPEGRFRTRPSGTAGELISFIVASDLHHPQGPFPDALFEDMARVDADFAVLLGDQIVIDVVTNNLGRCCMPRSQADYEGAYRDAWAYAPLRSFLANTPTAMTWDDHEILNDWDQGSSKVPYPWARAAYEEYVNSLNPSPRTPGGLNYVIEAGVVEIYVLDTRSHRSLGEAADGPDKTMLGREQKDDLKNWLRSSEAAFKFIASSVMWNDLSRHVEVGESWPAYRTERNEIFDFIKTEGIAGVVLLSGDEHWTGAFRIAPWGLYELAPAPLNQALDAPDTADPEVLFAPSAARSFGLFAVDTFSCPATLTARIVGTRGQVRYALSLTAEDLGAAPAPC